MHTIEILDKNIRVYIPEDLSECDTIQYINISRLASELHQAKIDIETFLHQAVQYLVLDKKVSKEKPGDEIKYQNISLLAETLTTFFENDANGNSILKQYYIHNPTEKIRVGFTNLYGPSDEFNNVTFGEYVDGLSYFYDYAETQDPAFLRLLMATFYRKKRNIFQRLFNYHLDKRNVYNADKVPAIAKKLERVDHGIVYGFFLLFTSFQKYLQTAKIYVQGKEIDLELLYKDYPTDAQAPKSDIPGIGMKSLLYTIAESGVFGSLQEVRNTKLWEILIRLYDIRKRDFDSLSTKTKN